MKAMMIFAALAITSLPLPATADMQPDAEALLQQGVDYAYGRKGKKKSEAKALECYKAAAEAGSAEAAYRLARMHYYGVGTKADKAKAKHYYETAAAVGHDKAQEELGKLFPADKALAPASVKGKKLIIRYGNAKLRTYSWDKKAYDAPVPWDGDATIYINFDKSTTPTFESGQKATYTKTGAANAKVEVEGWESDVVYTLDFRTPVSGSVSEEGTAEADKWTVSGATFELVPAK